MKKNIDLNSKKKQCCGRKDVAMVASSITVQEIATGKSQPKDPHIRKLCPNVPGHWCKITDGCNSEISQSQRPESTHAQTPKLRQILIRVYFT